MRVCQRLLACLVGTALAVGPAAGQDKKAPFEIPPEGKPEVLVGGIKFEGPSALAFDSRNRPYMFLGDPNFDRVKAFRIICPDRRENHEISICIRCPDAQKRIGCDNGRSDVK